MSALTRIAKAILKLDVKLHGLHSQLYNRVAVHQANKAAAIAQNSRKDAENLTATAHRRRRLVETAAWDTYTKRIQEAAVALQADEAHVQSLLGTADEAIDKHSAFGALVEAAARQHADDATRKAGVVGAL